MFYCRDLIADFLSPTGERHVSQGSSRYLKSFGDQVGALLHHQMLSFISRDLKGQLLRTQA